MQCRRGFLLMLIVWLLVGVCLGLAAELAPKPSEDVPPPDIVEKQTILLDILRSVEQLERDLKAKQREVRSPQAEGRKEELLQEIQQLSGKLKTLRENLSKIASGVDFDALTQQKQQDIDWKKTALDLLHPVINELTRLTARPREIEQLRTEVAAYQEQLRVAEKGLKNIARLGAYRQEPSLVPLFKQLQSDWEARVQELQTQISITSQQLKQQLDEQPSLHEAARNLVDLFFRSRGRNFILACVAFMVFWLLFYRLHNWLLNMRLLRRKRQTFSVRLFNVVYTFFTVVGATFCFLFVLYMTKDWVLLTLALLFLLGIAWTSKNTLPRFVREVTLLLNVGAVREGERVVYNGIPWLVRSLNFYTHLENPELLGGDLRLPIRDFHDLRSRPFGTDEPWFPTRVQDWVVIDDEVLGRVILQTPEIVRLVLLGGARQTFSTADFLAKSPTVLSTGFRVEVTFGLDYQHQPVITRDIPPTLDAALRDAFEREGYAKHLVNLSIEFAEAGASSLDIKVLADFAGAAAPQYQSLRRAIQRICVDACNAHGWVIPFTQITLHMASSSDNGAAPRLDVPAHDDEAASRASHAVTPRHQT
jgi:small-conductance mechanosensitive channel